MPTPLDRALQSRNALLGFAGFVTAAAAWTMWGSESMFPKEQDPTGPPEEWGVEQLRVWLRNVSFFPFSPFCIFPV